MDDEPEEGNSISDEQAGLAREALSCLQDILGPLCHAKALIFDNPHSAGPRELTERRPLLFN